MKIDVTMTESNQDFVTRFGNGILGGGVAVETDPTVPAWAKEATKPKYTADEVGALSAEELPNAVNLALEQAKESGEFDGKDGADGKDGVSGVYVGSGAMPEGYNVQIDPNGSDTYTTEAWTFELEDGSTVTKTVVVG